MNYCILVNTKYPYKAGETFLESEMRETWSKFDQILIFPIDASVKEEQTRKIPADNIKPILFEDDNIKFNKYVSAGKSLLKVHQYESESIKHKFYDSYFEQHAKDQAKKIIAKLDEIKFNKDDTVILYSYWFYTGARICVELKKYFENKVGKTTLVSRAHRFDVYEYENDKNYLAMREFLLDSFDKVFVCSEDGEKYMRNKYPKFTNKLTTARLGTYDHGYRKDKNRDVFEIVSCSRVTVIKRLSKIIEALSILDKKGLDFKWTHMGDGPLFEEAKEEAARLLPADKYEFLGRKANTEVYDYYSNHDVNLFVNVSTSEGLPVSIMEAISFGIPVVATDVGGTSEIILNERNGYLLEKDFEMNKLVDSIEDVMKMSEVSYDTICKESRKIWEDWFDAKKNYVDFADNIKSL